jgi:Sulfotransferase family
MISHKYRFIFVHVPKTGGSSIEAAFGIGHEFVNPEEPEDERHRSLGEYGRLFPEMFDDYFKFAFVRNPWDRMVSRYFQHRDDRHAKLARLDEQIAATGNAKKRIELEAKRANRLESVYLSSFREWLIQTSERIMKDRHQLREGSNNVECFFDFVGRFEYLVPDFQFVCKHIGFKYDLPHVNRSKHENYTSYYDDYSRDLVANLCAHDIERFGYRFGDDVASCLVPPSTAEVRRFDSIATQGLAARGNESDLPRQR